VTLLGRGPGRVAHLTPGSARWVHQAFTAIASRWSLEVTTRVYIRVLRKEHDR